MAYTNQGIITTSNTTWFTVPGSSSIGQAAPAGTVGNVYPTCWIRVKFRVPLTVSGGNTGAAQVGAFGTGTSSVSLGVDQVTRKAYFKFYTDNAFGGIVQGTTPLTPGSVYDMVLQFSFAPNPQGVQGHIDGYVIENASGGGGVQAYMRTIYAGTFGSLTSGTLFINGSFHTNWFQGTVYEFTKCQGSLTQAQMAQLGQGADVITDMGLTPDVHFKPASVGSISFTDFSANGNVATITNAGLATAGTAPSYAVPAISCDDITPVFAGPGGGTGFQKFLNFSGAKSVPVGGAYVGTAPASIDGQWVQASVKQPVSAAASGATALLLADTTGIITGCAVIATGIPAGTVAGAVVHSVSVALVVPGGGGTTAAIAAGTQVQFGDPTIVMVPWATMTGATISGGRWSAMSPPLTVGGRAQLQVRYTNSTGVTGSMQRRTACGLVVGLFGQSNEFNGTLTAGAAALTVENVGEITYNIWQPPTGIGVVALANAIGAEYPNVDIMLVMGAVSASGMYNYSSTGVWSDQTTVGNGTNTGSPLLYALAMVAYVGNDMNVMTYVQGENELTSTSTTATLLWKTDYQAMLQFIYGITGRSHETLLDLVALIGPQTLVLPNTDAQAYYLRLANEMAGRASVPSRISQDHANFIVNTANVHCAVPHYATLSLAKNRSIMSFLKRDRAPGIGPHIIKAKFSGNRASVWVKHENGRNLILRNPAQPLCGMQFGDNAGAVSIVSQILLGNRIDFLLSRALGAGASVGHLQGHAMVPGLAIGQTQFTGFFGTGAATTALTVSGVTGFGLAAGQTIIYGANTGTTITSGSGTNWVATSQARPTPANMVASDPSQIATVSGSANITISGLPTGHGILAGYYMALDLPSMVAFAGFATPAEAAAPGGASLSTEYVVVSAAANSIVVTAYQAATATANGGGINCFIRQTNWLLDDSNVVGEALPVRQLTTTPIYGRNTRSLSPVF